MRCQSYIVMCLVILQKISNQVFKGQFSLCKWSLVNGRQDLAIFDQGDQVFIEIGCNNMNFIEQIEFIKRLQNRLAICCAQIESLRTISPTHQLQRLAVCFPRLLVAFKCREQPKMRSLYG